MHHCANAQETLVTPKKLSILRCYTIILFKSSKVSATRPINFMASFAGFKLKIDDDTRVYDNLFSTLCPAARQISVKDLTGKPFCKQHPVPSGCGDNKIVFKINVRQGDRCTWWVTCNFNKEKRDNVCTMTHRFDTILCYDLTCSSK